MSIYPRTQYEMTEEDLKVILDACKPVPCIMIGGHAPRSQQENANSAWKALGVKMGFDHMTVKPAPGGNRFFTAVPSETDDQRKGRLLKEADEKRKAKIVTLEAEIDGLQDKLATLLKEAVSCWTQHRHG